MRNLVLIIWIVPALYLCIGGVSNIIISKNAEEARLLPENPRTSTGGARYRNKAEQDAREDYDSMMQFYPGYGWVGETITYLFNLMAFGVLGSCIRILFQRISGIAGVPNERLVPLFGLLLGFVVIVVDEFLPEFKYHSGKEKFYYSIALLGGIYSLELYQWLGKRFLGFLQKEEK
jgi:hypothetical protein